jgi:hypothetical protein
LNKSKEYKNYTNTNFDFENELTDIEKNLKNDFQNIEKRKELYHNLS